MGDGGGLARSAAALAGDVVTAAVGSPTRVADVTVVRDGDPAVLALTVVRRPRRLLLKVFGDDARPAIDVGRTAAVMRRAAAAGVPVADVLAADGSRRMFPWAYSLTEYAEGTEWRDVHPVLDDGELRAAHRQIASAVLAIQSVEFAAFGDLDATATPDGHDVVEALRHRARLRIAREANRDLFLRALETRAAAFSGERAAVLTHDDLHHSNVLFRRARDGWRLAAVLDWDKAWSGPPESDVARMAFWDGMTGPGFWEVYRAAVPPSAGAEDRALVHQLLWCLEYDVGSARHARDTAEVLHQLGIR